MVSFTANQWAILFLVLVLGWLLGMLSRSGGAKWRRAAAEERAAREAAEARLEGASARIAELEHERPVPATPPPERPIVEGDEDIP